MPKSNPPVTLEIDCNPQRVTSHEAGDIAAARHNEVEKIGKLNALGQYHHLDVQCGGPRNGALLVVDGNQVLALHSIAENPVQATDRQGLPLTDNHGNPRMILDKAKLDDTMAKAKVAMEQWADTHGVSHAVHEILPDVRSLPVKIIPPKLSNGR